MLATAGLVVALGGCAIDAADGVTTLNFFQFKGEALEDFNQIIADFEAENPDIKVVQNQVADADTIIRTLLVKDKAPDVITLNANGGFGKLAQAGVFYDFSDEPVLQTINPAVQEILARPRQQGGRGQRPRLRQQRQRRDLQPGHLRGAGARGPRDLGRVHRRLRRARRMPASPRSTARSPTRGPGCRRSTRWARTRRRATSSTRCARRARTSARTRRCRSRRTSPRRWTSSTSCSPTCRTDTAARPTTTATPPSRTARSRCCCRASGPSTRSRQVNPDIKAAIFPYPATDDPDDRLLVSGVDVVVTMGKNTPHKEEAMRFIDYLFEKDVIEEFAASQNMVPSVEGAELSDDPSLQSVKPFFDDGQDHRLHRSPDPAEHPARRDRPAVPLQRRRGGRARHPRQRVGQGGRSHDPRDRRLT